jgi:hypothetical protein
MVLFMLFPEHDPHSTQRHMNDKRVGLGILTWFLAITVPTYHHIALVAATGPHPTNNDIESVFNSLPWIDWVYLVAMTITGSVLVVSGMLGKPSSGKRL